MLRIFLKEVIILSLILSLNLSPISGNCMNARSTSSDADCYLNHLARENVMRMGVEGSCHSPRQQVVYPEDMGKMFMPRGTLLFRCNDYSGCCPQKEHSCQPIQEEELRVAFYAIDCNSGESRPQPEYVLMKNHTKCGCRPSADTSLDPSPQRLQHMICGNSGQQQQPSAYKQSFGSGTGFRGSYDQIGYGSQYSSSSPCANSMSSRPLVDGQVVRGTIRLTVGPKGFRMSDNQQQPMPCPYG